MAFIPCYPPGNMPDECVYIIALERPACAPTRVKIGYTRNLQRRLKAFPHDVPECRSHMDTRPEREIPSAICSQKLDVSRKLSRLKSLRCSNSRI